MKIRDILDQIGWRDNRSWTIQANEAPIEFPAATVSGEARGGSTAGGVTHSAPGFFSHLRNALRGRAAAGAITHGNARRQRAREHAAAMMATEALSDLTADQAVAIIRMHLRTRPDIEPGALHALANQLSGHADDMESGCR